MGITV